jgi:hypothetical protein
VWLPSVHLLFRPGAEERAALADHGRAGPAGAGPLSPRGRALLARQLALWEDPAQRAAALARMRASNAEWDFMGRTFLVLALANAALREPAERARYLAVVDRIVDETLALERERGMLHFMMPYAAAKPFLAQPPRSVFVDGEIALMLGARALVEPRPDRQGALEERAELIRQRMEQGPVLSAESYPDECWTFCNTLALAALRVADVVRGDDRSADLAGRWVEAARARLVDPATGILVSSYTLGGRTLDGPEGSSIWVAAHALLLVDPAFAEDQYARARRHLGAEFAGFGWAREWPRSRRGPEDVDSGPIVPLLDASAGSSGLALLGAAAFRDGAALEGLLTTLDFAAFPIEEGGALRYAASNQVGDAALLYALSFGPLWAKAARAAPAGGPS